MIKDRRHHLRTYPNCFVAKELIDWLIEHKEASDRDTAIKIVQKLLDQSIIHHGRAVCVCEREHVCVRKSVCESGFSIFYNSKALSPSPSVFFLTFSGNKPSLLMDDSLGLLANLAPVERLIPASHLTTETETFFLLSYYLDRANV